MEIGIMGLTFNSGNKGCEALSYSFLELLESVLKRKQVDVTVNIITLLPLKKILKQRSIKNVEKEYYPKKNYNHIKFKCLFYINKNNKCLFLGNPKKCVAIFDYTFGDSFTDIYGDERFWNRTRCKKTIIDKKIPLILGSQTIGPFNSNDIIEAAVEVIRKSKEVYVRDQMSYDYVIKISGIKPKLTTDIAFALPFEKINIGKYHKPRVGINVSGLLWNGGYTQNNQFGLTVNYQAYCRELIEKLQEKYEIHLIPHAFIENNFESKDNDYIAIAELCKEFPDIMVCNYLETPMKIKSYISQMDVFIGARMHATIAAFSAGVPVIPFSYSRKFEGLYSSLKYEYVIHGKESNTAEAINRTVEYVENRELLKQSMKEGKNLIIQSNNFIQEELEKILFD